MSTERPFYILGGFQNYVSDKLRQRIVADELELSKLNAWVRITSLTDRGLILTSNPNIDLFSANGSLYGTSTMPGSLGIDIDGNPIGSTIGQPYRPSPTISSVSIDQSAGGISRKADFTITVYTLEQLQEMAKYFLEPSHNIFIEWGWNTESGIMGALSDDELKVIKNISDYSNNSTLNNKRKTADGEYDAYLGMIVGGNITNSGDTWELSVECRGMGEAANWMLTTADTDEGDEEVETADLYTSNDLSSKDAPYKKKNWMIMFNELPSSRQTGAVKSLEKAFLESPTAEIDLLNFDTDNVSKVNKLAGGSTYTIYPGRPLHRVKIPNGMELYSDAKFIRFGLLMVIMNSMFKDVLTVGDNEIQLVIDSGRTECSAFPNIFSTDVSKLFIPNKRTPKIKLDEQFVLTRDDEIPLIDDKIFDNSFKVGETVVNFPIIDDDGGGLVAGRLDDLYVNFDFAKSVMETKNITKRDALYQILNGMSSAVNGMWDFQIMEYPIYNATGKEVSTSYEVVEMGMPGIAHTSASEKELFSFDLIGSKSILTNSSLSIQISGAKMNSIIAKSISRKQNTDVKTNTDAGPTPGTNKEGIFSNKKNLIDLKIKQSTGEAEADGSDNKTPPDLLPKWLPVKLVALEILWNLYKKRRSENKAAIAAKKKTIETQLGKISLMTGTGIRTRLAAYDDNSLFKFLRGSGKDSAEESKDLYTPLLPIEFSCTLQGISGIKFGDIFRVNGLPDMYGEGVFQVTAIKHTITDMKWETELTGGYRAVPGKTRN